MSTLMLVAVILAIVLFFLACVVVSAVAALAAWKASKLEAPLRSLADSLEKLVKPVAEVVPVLGEARTAVQEIKGIQEGTYKQMAQSILAIRTLTTVVESFENTILPPEKRLGTATQPMSENDEMVLEKRLKEREAARGGLPKELNEQIGKLVGTA